MALKCGMINSEVPNARSWCWDQFQQFQAAKIANNSGGKGFLHASWPRRSGGTTHGTHIQKKAHTTQGAFPKARNFQRRLLQESWGDAATGPWKDCWDEEALESPSSRNWDVWLPQPGVDKEGWGDLNLPGRGLHSKDKRELVKAQPSPQTNKQSRHTLATNALRVQMRVMRVGSASSSSSSGRGKEVKPAAQPRPAKGDSWAAFIPSPWDGGCTNGELGGPTECPKGWSLGEKGVTGGSQPPSEQCQAASGKKVVSCSINFSSVHPKISWRAHVMIRLLFKVYKGFYHCNQTPNVLIPFYRKSLVIYILLIILRMSWELPFLLWGYFLVLVWFFFPRKDKFLSSIKLLIISLSPFTWAMFSSPVLQAPCSSVFWWSALGSSAHRVDPHYAVVQLT